MALEAESDRGSSRSAHEKYPRAALERNGYVKTCVTPLYQDAECQSWLRLAVTWSSRGVSSAVCVASVSVILALLLRLVDWDVDTHNSSSSRSSSSSSNESSSEPGSLLHFATSGAAELLLAVWYLFSPVFTLVCAFFWVGLYLIRCGVLVRTAVFLLAVCHLGEAAAQSLLRGAEDQLLSFPATLVVLGCLSGALLAVRVRQGVSILVFISIIRAVSLVSLSTVRAGWRPYLAYLLGLLGVLLARYADRLLPAPGTSGTGCCGSVTGAKEEDIPVFKRRRRSSSVAASDMMAHQSSKSHRRTSLPCIPRDQMERQLFYGSKAPAESALKWRTNAQALPPTKRQRLEPKPARTAMPKRGTITVPEDTDLKVPVDVHPPPINPAWPPPRNSARAKSSVKCRTNAQVLPPTKRHSLEPKPARTAVPKPGTITVPEDSDLKVPVDVHPPPIYPARPPPRNSARAKSSVKDSDSLDVFLDPQAPAKISPAPSVRMSVLSDEEYSREEFDPPPQLDDETSHDDSAHSVKEFHLPPQSDVESSDNDSAHSVKEFHLPPQSDVESSDDDSAHSVKEFHLPPQSDVESSDNDSAHSVKEFHLPPQSDEETSDDESSTGSGEVYRPPAHYVESSDDDSEREGRKEGMLFNTLGLL